MTSLNLEAALNRVDASGRRAVSQLATFFSTRLFAGLVLVTAVALAVVPDQMFSGLPGLCPFRFLTGLPCPGCGITHAAHALIHGHLSEAITLHPFAIILGAASVVCFPIRALSGFTFAAPRWSGLVFYGFTAAWITWWLVRIVVST